MAHLDYSTESGLCGASPLNGIRTGARVLCTIRKWITLTVKHCLYWGCSRRAVKQSVALYAREAGCVACVQASDPDTRE